jgi:MFS family permease
MRRYFIFVSAGLSLLMYSIDSTVVAVAFPHFIKDLDTNVLWAAWTISIYLLAVTSVMPLMGNLSDSFGRKRVFLISLILFTASSLACGLHPISTAWWHLDSFKASEEQAFSQRQQAS